MFSKSKQPPIRSLVAQGCCVQGDIVFTDGLGIDGTVEGMVQGVPPSDAALAKKSKGTMVFVSEQGRVLGGIRADTVIINGLVEGPVCAERILELQPKARISGDVSYRQLEMHQGALISGRMLPILPEPPKTVAATPSPHAVHAVNAAATPAPLAAPAAEGASNNGRLQEDNPLQSLDALLSERQHKGGTV